MVQYWEPGTQYNNGDVVEFKGYKYKIIQPHRSQSDWEPSNTPALWGKMSDNDHNYDNRNNQQQPQQYQPPSQPAYSSSPQYGSDQGGYPQDKPSGSEHHEEKKHWWGDDENKKKLEIGGGLLAGAAALGAGIFAYKEHEKKKEEHSSQNWAKSNWLADAQSRTEDLHRNGPRGPATWVLNHGKSIPQGALTISNDPFNMFTCRTYVDGGIQLGKASGEFQKGAVIGYKNEEMHFDEYEILVGDMGGLRWVSASGQINVSNLGARPVEGGRENDGTPLYIVRAYYKEAVHPGKTSSKLDGAYIPWGGKEKAVQEYEVLCYA
ncbi:hypothetical protein AX17_005809 [Amanita inopinata Kibby_2008]|nr:hypothetical protein AX17_005809 [Amanita inopinata Kibby_2008]